MRSSMISVKMAVVINVLQLAPLALLGHGAHGLDVQAVLRSAAAKLASDLGTELQTHNGRDSVCASGTDAGPSGGAPDPCQLAPGKFPS